MSASVKKNLAASVRQRLLQLSRERKEPFDLVLTRYGVERLLYRLGCSSYAGQFLLKGAMLFHVWTDSVYRPTRDVDLLDAASTSLAELERIFGELCSLPVEPDGLEFQPASVRVSPIRQDAAYGGIRVEMEACLEIARIFIQCDVGFGDAVTPGPEIVEFPALLNFPPPRLRAYPIYTVVAEKVEAMARLGEANSRMKDFYDVWFLCRQFDFDGNTLVKAFRATFARRKTKWPEQTPLFLTDDFARLKRVQWNAFLRKNQLPIIDLETVINTLRQFLEEPLLRSEHRRAFAKKWLAAAKWLER